ncbi:MAG: hypothetical protein HUU48_01830 [Flavobacteriales bacterium]|nr:hypothetical protein [Flavobacteriales bacterium]
MVFVNKIATLCAGFVFFLTSHSFAQHSELGLFLGTSYYIGELNPTKHFNQCYLPAAGFVYRKNLSKRYSLKTTLLYGKLKASDYSTQIAFNSFRNYAMSGPIYEASGQLEFNFLEYQIGIKEKNHTPYVFIGVSAFLSKIDLYYNGNNKEKTIFNSENVTDSWMSNVVIPFGIGYKFNLGGSFGASIEWGMRKTYTDELDRLENVYAIGYQKGNAKNYDWYNFSGIIITYKFRKAFDRCPHLF